MFILEPRLIIHKPYGSNFTTILDIFVSHWKNWLLSRGYFGSLGHALVAIGVIERFKQESLYGLFSRTRKSGHCGEIAISGGSTVLCWDHFNHVFYCDHLQFINKFALWLLFLILVLSRLDRSVGKVLKRINFSLLRYY